MLIRLAGLICTISASLQVLPVLRNYGVDVVTSRLISASCRTCSVHRSEGRNTSWRRWILSTSDTAGLLPAQQVDPASFVLVHLNAPNQLICGGDALWTLQPVCYKARMFTELCTLDSKYCLQDISRSWCVRVDGRWWSPASTVSWSLSPTSSVFFVFLCSGWILSVDHHTASGYVIKYVCSMHNHTSIWGRAVIVVAVSIELLVGGA